MSYGINILNDAGNVVIDDTFNTLALLQKVTIAYTGSIMIYDSFQDGYSVQIDVDPAYEYFMLSSTPIACMTSILPVTTWNGSVYVPNYSKRLLIVAVEHVASPPASVDVYVYSTKRPANGTYGIIVYNASGVAVFNSEAYGMDVLTVVTLPITQSNGAETVITINNPGSEDFLYMCPYGMGGTYVISDIEYQIAVRKISLTQIGIKFISVHDGGKDGIPSMDTRHTVVFPLYRKPLI